MRKRFHEKIELLIVLCLYPVALLAHQPRLVQKQTDILVDSPEISKAYYGTLAGKPALYRIEAAEPFKLYVNVLVPKIAGTDKDVSARIRRQGMVIAVMHPGVRDWKPFFEPFAGDEYFRGPEFTAVQEPGSYEIEVYSPDNQGKYVLAIGDKEAFPLGELIRTYSVLPRLKSDFFGKSPLSAYWNIMGILLLVVVLLATGIAVVVFRCIRYAMKRHRVSPEIGR